LRARLFPGSAPGTGVNRDFSPCPPCPTPPRYRGSDLDL
jgi:hypothetical protein